MLLPQHKIFPKLPHTIPPAQTGSPLHQLPSPHCYMSVYTLRSLREGIISLSSLACAFTTGRWTQTNLDSKLSSTYITVSILIYKIK